VTSQYRPCKPGSINGENRPSEQRRTGPVNGSSGDASAFIGDVTNGCGAFVTQLHAHMDKRGMAGHAAAAATVAPLLDAYSPVPCSTLRTERP
jgi:hypothetical protein